MHAYIVFTIALKKKMLPLKPEISLLRTCARQNTGTCAQKDMYKGIHHSIICNSEKILNNPNFHLLKRIKLLYIHSVEDYASSKKNEIN